MVSPDQISVPPTMRGACERLLAAWDARDPWDDAAATVGIQLLSLTFLVSLPLVPALETPEAAAKFLRAELSAQ